MKHFVIITIFVQCCCVLTEIKSAALESYTDRTQPFAQQEQQNLIQQQRNLLKQQVQQSPFYYPQRIGIPNDAVLPMIPNLYHPTNPTTTTNSYDPRLEQPTSASPFSWSSNPNVADYSPEYAGRREQYFPAPQERNNFAPRTPGNFPGPIPNNIYDRNNFNLPPQNYPQLMAYFPQQQRPPGDFASQGLPPQSINQDNSPQYAAHFARYLRKYPYRLTPVFENNIKYNERN